MRPLFLLWLPDMPLTVSCVRRFRAWRDLDWDVRILLADDVHGCSSLPEVQTKFHPVRVVSPSLAPCRDLPESAVQEDCEEADNSPALALYTTSAPVAAMHDAAFHAYSCYVIPPRVTPVPPLPPPWTLLDSPFPPALPPHWLVTSPHLIPSLAAHDFVMYIKPGMAVDATMLNRAIVDLLQTSAALGACEHDTSFPSSHELLNFHTKPVTGEMREYLVWRLAHGVCGGGDGGEGRRVYDTRVVLHDMRHTGGARVLAQWAAEASASGEDTISLFCMAQVMQVPLLILPGHITTTNSSYCMRRLVRIPASLPPPPPPAFDQGVSAPLPIPRRLHLLWLGDAPLPAYCTDNYARWKQLMPHWEVMLWRDADLALFPDTVQARVAQARKGAQKADILRAFILTKWGGIYIDADMEPRRSLEPLVQLNEPVVLCHELPLTWEYVSNAMIAAAPSHPLILFLAHYLLTRSTLNTPEVHMETGPRILGYAVRHAPNASGKPYCMLPSRAFFFNEQTPDAFAVHKQARTWCE